MEDWPGATLEIRIRVHATGQKIDSADAAQRGMGCCGEVGVMEYGESAGPSIDAEHDVFLSNMMPAVAELVD